MPRPLGPLAAVLFAANVFADGPPLAADRRPDHVAVSAGGGDPVLVYRTAPPAPNPLPVDSGGFFHPLRTPAGTVVTDLAPADHKHHRGVFLAWVEMHGVKDADFWGWGAHAPVTGRRVVTRDVADLISGPGGAGFRVKNDWMADDARVLAEDLKADVAVTADGTVLDLAYTLTPDADTTLARWAFSGFCVRVRGDAAVAAVGPDGPVKRPNPKHTDPDSDWPAADWYGYDLRLKDGTRVGVAVVDHPGNPPCRWHNLAPVKMLNPCIVAPGPVKLPAGQPLVLKYRVVAADGPLAADKVAALAADFRGRK